MPEWPEVRRVIDLIEPTITHKIVHSATFAAHLKSSALAVSSIKGMATFRVEQRGKWVVIKLAKRPASKRISCVLLVHLGMSGMLHMRQREDLPLKHEHMRLELTSSNRDTVVLCFTDPRRFGRVILCGTQAEYHSAMKNTGRDFIALFDKSIAASSEQSVGVARAAKRAAAIWECYSKKWSIKSVLMDQSRLAGIGNIYAAEALFRAGMAPTRRLSDCDPTQLKKLAHELYKLLILSYSRGGSSISSYRVEGVAGSAQNLHQVYGRGGLPCYKCKTALLSKEIDGRATVWCEMCQT